MAGQYAAAIASYDRALGRRPDWGKAKDNRALAAARQQLLAPPADGEEGTGGKVEADEIVFDDRAQASAASQTDVTGGGAASDADAQALWLRRV